MKKRGNLLFCLILVLTFVFAFASAAYADEPATVQTLIAEYQAKYGNLDVLDEAAQIADYEKILLAYDKATGDALPVETLAQLVNLAASYSQYVQGNTPGATSSDRAANKAIHDYVAATIATAKMQQAFALITRIQEDTVKGRTTYNGDSTTAIANREKYTAFMEALSAADERVKEYFCLFNMTFNATTYDGFYAKGAPHGFFAASMLAAEARYLRDTTYDADTDKNVTALLDAMANLSASNSTILSADMKAVLTLSSELYSSLQSYVEQNGSLSPTALLGLQAKVEALTAAQAAFMQAMKATSFIGNDANCFALMGELNSNAITPKTIYTIASQADALVALIERMNQYDATSTQYEKNMLYREVREAFEALDSATQSFAKTALFTDLYEDIEDSFVSNPNRPEPIVPQADDFIKTPVQPSPAGKQFINEYIAALNIMLRHEVGSANEWLYTNEAISTLAGLNAIFYDILSEAGAAQGNQNTVKDLMDTLDATGSAPTVQAMAKHLSEPQFAEASAKFATMESWADYNGSLFSWGFADGDREGFLNAAIAVLRPITSLLYNYAGLHDYVDAKYQDYIFGTYNTVLVPLLEALDCRGILSYDEYLAEVAKLQDATANSYSKKQDALGYAIINPLLNLAEDFSKNPLNILLDLIPSLAYAQKNGELQAFYQLEVNFSFKALGVADVAVKIKVFEELGITNADDILALLEKALGAELPAFDWDALAYMGSPMQRNSAYIDRTLLNDIKADRADVFVTLHLAEWLNKNFKLGSGSAVSDDAFTHTVNFNSQGGSAVASQSIATNGTAKSPTDPVRAGYSFLGWYTDAECSKEYDFSTKVAKEITLYAGWKWNNPFADVKQTDWFYGDVEYAYQNNMMQGPSATMFSPCITTSRAMLVTILWRIEGSPVVDDFGLYANFADVAQGSYYEKAVAWAAKNGLITGYGEGNFSPDDNVTRQDFATILWRYAKWKGLDVSAGEDTNILSYNDALDISEYAMAAMQWACGQGIISGKPGALLDPAGNTSRAEAAAMLHRFLMSFM